MRRELYPYWKPLICFQVTEIENKVIFSFPFFLPKRDRGVAVYFWCFRGQFEVKNIVILGKGIRVSDPDPHVECV